MVRLSRRHLLGSIAGGVAVGAVPRSLVHAAPPGGALPGPSGANPSILGSYRLVDYYGNPEASGMGILGQLSPAELVAAIQRRAAAYQSIGGVATLGVVHMVVTVAQGSPGPDGMYRARMPASLISSYVDLAARNGLLFVADVQVGQSTVQAEVPVLDAFLREPHVHLALDPEFDMWGSQVPGVELGHMTAAELNWAQSYLSNLAASTGQRKLLITYQFAASMLPDRANIGSAPAVDLAIVMDGWGGEAVKIDHYNAYVASSSIPYGGIKLFFDWDSPLMTEGQVLGLSPSPNIIIYQ